MGKEKVEKTSGMLSNFLFVIDFILLSVEERKS